METIKSLTKEAKEAGYENYMQLLDYWDDCGNTDFYKTFANYTSRLLFDIVDNSSYDSSRYQLYCAATKILMNRLHVKK